MGYTRSLRWHHLKTGFGWFSPSHPHRSLPFPLSRLWYLWSVPWQYTCNSGSAFLAAAPSGHPLHLPIREIGELRSVSHAIEFRYWSVGSIIAFLLYHFPQVVGFLNLVPPAAIAVGGPWLFTAIHAISIRADLLDQEITLERINSPFPPRLY